MSSRISADHIRLKRAYEPPASDDGVRILIDRLWLRNTERPTRSRRPGGIFSTPYRRRPPCIVNPPKDDIVPLRRQR
jgi:hypothetical protein